MKLCKICRRAIQKGCNESKRLFKKRKYCSRECFYVGHAEWMSNRIISKETRGKLSKAFKGRKLSEEQKRKISKSRKGKMRRSNHWKWKGGRIMQNGYWVILVGANKYRTEQRLIMEEYLGRKLKRAEIVHHINGNKLDNRIANLKVMTRAEHAKLHYSIANLLN